MAAAPAFKTITLLKRHASLTMDAFIAQYESGHARIGEKYLKGGALRYVRRFLHPVNLGADTFVEPDYDVVMEIWFADRAAYDAMMQKLGKPDVVKEIAADEALLFDRSKTRMFFVTEYESQLR